MKSRSLRIGVIGSGASSQKLTRLLAEQGLSILHAISPSDITDEHINARDIDVWLLDLADADWNDALDDLMDRSSIPIFFNEHGAVDRQQHLDYWSRNLISRIQELVSDSDLEPVTPKANETLHIAFPDAKSAIAPQPVAPAVSTPAPAKPVTVDEHLLDDIAELESLLQRKPHAVADQELQTLVSDLSTPAAPMDDSKSVTVDKAEAAKQRAEKMMRERSESDRLAREKIESEHRAIEQQALADAEAARLEAERFAQERLHAERVAQEKADAAKRLAAHIEAERLAREKAEAERVAKEKAEAERREAERIAKEKAEAERREAERIAREKAEAERIAKEKAEAERIAKERAEAERREAERIALEKAEAERIAKEKAEAERIAKEKAEAERREAERIAREKAEAERIAKEKAEAERIAKEKAEAERREAERIAREKAEAERIAKEKAEAERVAKEKAEAERREAERIAKEKAEAERVAKEKAEAERREAERIAREKAEAERIAKEKAEAERVAKEKAEAAQREAERLEAERVAREKAEIERIAAEKIAAEIAERERPARLEAARIEAERLVREKAEREARLRNVEIVARPSHDKVIELATQPRHIESDATPHRGVVHDDDVPLLETHDNDIDAPLLDAFALEGEFEAVPHKILSCDLWVLGASLGGPAALKRFFGALVEPIPVCFVIAQHIDAHFVAVLGKILEQSNSFYHVQVLSRPSLIEAGWTLLVPIEKRLRFLDAGQIVHSAHNWTPPYSPCIDDVLLDAVNAYHSQVHCIIFSGMGEDGSAGAARIRNEGGEVWVQDRDSCASSVMPDAIVQHDLATYQGTPEQLAEKLMARYRQQTTAQTRA